jgi:hypothetical protein
LGACSSKEEMKALLEKLLTTKSCCQDLKIEYFYLINYLVC